MVNNLCALNSYIPDGSYTTSSTIVACPKYPTGTSYTGTATVTSTSQYGCPYKFYQKTISSSETISGTAVTGTEIFNKCGKYSYGDSTSNFFQGEYKTCKKYFGNVMSKYKGYSVNYAQPVKGKSVYTPTATGFTETIYYKLFGCYTQVQQITYTKVV